MSYRWQGDTPRHEAVRQLADAQWEHDQHAAGQQRRRATERTWQAQAIADAISRPVTVTAEGTTS